MSKFEAVGRQHIIDQIEALESAEPGWLPMFYFAGSYEADLAAAQCLRKAYDMPRPDEVSRRISTDKTRFVERQAIAQAERDHHERRMREDWLYWIGIKIGLLKREPRN